MFTGIAPLLTVSGRHRRPLIVKTEFFFHEEIKVTKTSRLPEVFPRKETLTFGLETARCRLRTTGIERKESCRRKSRVRKTRVGPTCLD